MEIDDMDIEKEIYNPLCENLTTMLEEEFDRIKIVKVVCKYVIFVITYKYVIFKKNCRMPSM